MAENPGVVQMADIAHLLALLFSAQHKGEDALSIVELYLIDYPDNLNLLITRSGSLWSTRDLYRIPC